MRLEDVAGTAVRAIKRREPARVGPDEPMFKVVAAMTASHRGAALVEEHGKLIGIFTEHDVMTRLDHSDLAWMHVPVRDVMTAWPTVIQPEDSITEALRRLNAGQRRHLPVVDGAGKVLGILSVRDLLRYVAERFPDDFINLPSDPDHEATGEWGG
jgi:CBS domain-containing protein